MEEKKREREKKREKKKEKEEERNAVCVWRIKKEGKKREGNYITIFSQ